MPAPASLASATPASATLAPATPACIAEWVAALDTVDGLPLAEHAERYLDLLTRLQAALADIDGI